MCGCDLGREVEDGQTEGLALGWQESSGAIVVLPRMCRNGENSLSNPGKSSATPTFRGVCISQGEEHRDDAPLPGSNPLGVRTQDPFIKSEVLYLLS